MFSLSAAGGWLLVNPSHGDAAIAAIDPRYELVGVVQSRSGAYSVGGRDLGSYLIPKRDIEVTPDLVHEARRGIAYTREAFAYLFCLMTVEDGQGPSPTARR